MEELPWDSAHFGFTVARIAGDCLSTEKLERALDYGKQTGKRLVYWSAPADQVVERGLLDAYCGLLVDLKATYAADLAGLVRYPSPDASARAEATVVPFRRRHPTPQLLALGVAAGATSRFHADPGINRETADELFRIWIRRSVSREMADTVLVVPGVNDPDDVRGVVTVRAAGGSGSIGLIAVDRRYRRQGLGGRLLQAAHRWMFNRGLRSAEVVTQRRNRAACRLYEKAGYMLREVRRFYHFWPTEGRLR